MVNAAITTLAIVAAVRSLIWHHSKITSRAQNFFQKNARCMRRRVKPLSCKFQGLCSAKPRNLLSPPPGKIELVSASPPIANARDFAAALTQAPYLPHQGGDNAGIDVSASRKHWRLAEADGAARLSPPWWGRKQILGLSRRLSLRICKRGGRRNADRSGRAAPAPTGINSRPLKKTFVPKQSLIIFLLRPTAHFIPPSHAALILCPSLPRERGSRRRSRGEGPAPPAGR